MSFNQCLPTVSNYQFVQMMNFGPFTQVSIQGLMALLLKLVTINCSFYTSLTLPGEERKYPGIPCRTKNFEELKHTSLHFFFHQNNTSILDFTSTRSLTNPLLTTQYNWAKMLSKYEKAGQTKYHLLNNMFIKSWRI